MEARYYKKEKDSVNCFLCRHNCKIPTGKTGICGVRRNEGGVLKSLVYGKPCSIAVDPIEKKPIFHFKPGSLTLSYATFGCNFKCSFCQNWQISQTVQETDYVEPERIVELALENGCEGIAHTYTEPTIFFEYAFDIAKLAHKKGLYNIFVTNGYAGDKPLEDIKPYLDVANIDLKGFNSAFYRKICGADLEKVLQGIMKYAELGIGLEITNLIIPGKNDDLTGIKDMCGWIVQNLGDKTPLHLSRYHPSYNLTIDPTPTETLQKAKEIAKGEGLKFVYVGNVANEDSNTHCYSCGSLLIKRAGYTIYENRIVNGRCPECNAESYVVS